MKEKLLKLLQAKEDRKKELGQKANATEDIKELRAINTELEAINGEITELRGMIDAIPDETLPAVPPGSTGNAQPPEQRGASPIGTTQILGSYAIGTGTTPQAEHRAAETDDPYGTIEYRQAFRTFATTGQITQELRANAMTTTGDVSAVIPSTILNEVIR
jgi:HK97 family phage major capsid protein